MPRYAIERQYLLPVYHHVMIEADSLEAACQIAVDNDHWPEADTKLDFESARPTTVTAAVVVDEQHRDEEPTWLLYEAGLPHCEIPKQHRGEPDPDVIRCLSRNETVDDVADWLQNHQQAYLAQLVRDTFADTVAE